MPRELDHGTLLIEFIVTDPADPEFQVIYPSNESDGRLRVAASSESMDVVGVKSTTVTQLKGEFQTLQNEFAGQVLPRVDTVEGKQTQLETQFTDVVSGVTDDAEILSARTGPDGTYATIGQRMDATTTQLAETELEKVRDKTITPTKALINFTFDDADKENFNVLKPLFDSYGFKFSTPIIYDFMGEIDGNYLSRQTLLAMQAEGYEMLSHTKAHDWIQTTIDTAGDYYFETELGEAKRLLEAAGFKIEGFCYPRGHHNKKAIEVARKYYKYAITTTAGYNDSPIDTFRMLRMGMSASGGYKTLAEYKAMVDEAIANNKLLLFYSHGHEYRDAEQVQILDDLLAYIASVNVPVVSMSEAMKSFANKVDIGSKNEPHFLVGATGEVDSTSLPIAPPSKFARINTTPITSFVSGKIEYSEISNANALNFPESIAGLLVTYRGLGDIWSFQEYFLRQSNKIYKRYWNTTTGAWDSWLKVSADTVYPIASLPIPTRKYNDPIGIFTPQKMEYAEIPNSGALYFPESTAGLLKTYRGVTDAWSFQEYHLRQSTKIYKRFWDLATNDWSAWVKVSV